MRVITEIDVLQFRPVPLPVEAVAAEVAGGTGAGEGETVVVDACHRCFRADESVADFTPGQRDEDGQEYGGGQRECQRRAAHEDDGAEGGGDEQPETAAVGVLDKTRVFVPVKGRAVGHGANGWCGWL